MSLAQTLPKQILDMDQRFKNSKGTTQNISVESYW